MRRILHFAAVFITLFGSLAYLGLNTLETEVLALSATHLPQNQLRASGAITVYMPTIFKEDAPVPPVLSAISSQQYDDPNCAAPRIAFAIRVEYTDNEGDFQLNPAHLVLVELDFDNSEIERSFLTPPSASGNNQSGALVVATCIAFNQSPGVKVTVSTLGSNKVSIHLAKP